MTWVLTNDDGIDAPGIQALRQTVEGLHKNILVAPQEHLSGCSHQATTHALIPVEERTSGDYAVGGTPVDCVRLALTEWLPDTEWVLSGINDGGNLGVDVLMSGTVAAAREAALLGKRAIAISQYRRSQEIKWDLSAKWAEQVLKELMKRPLHPGSFWNVNLPDPVDTNGQPEMVVCAVDPQPLPINYQSGPDGFRFVGRYHERRRNEGADVDTCFKGKIAISELTVYSGFSTLVS